MSWRTIHRHHEEDLAFLDRVKKASAAELARMQRDHQRAPDWKQEAIRRAIERAATKATGDGP